MAIIVYSSNIRKYLLLFKQGHISSFIAFDVTNIDQHQTLFISACRSILATVALRLASCGGEREQLADWWNHGVTLK